MFYYKSAHLKTRYDCSKRPQIWEKGGKRILCNICEYFKHCKKYATKKVASHQIK